MEELVKKVTLGYATIVFCYSGLVSHFVRSSHSLCPLIFYLCPIYQPLILTNYTLVLCTSTENLPPWTRAWALFQAIFSASPSCEVKKLYMNDSLHHNSWLVRHSTHSTLGLLLWHCSTVTLCNCDLGRYEPSNSILVSLQYCLWEYTTSMTLPFSFSSGHGCLQDEIEHLKDCCDSFSPQIFNVYAQ